MASDDTPRPPAPRGIPARLKLLEQRIVDLEEEILSQHGREGPVLAEARRVLALCLDNPKRLAALENEVATLKRRLRRR